jgi:hypothetical protein
MDLQTRARNILLSPNTEWPVIAEAGVQGQKENDQVSERTERIGGRLVHQRVSKTGGSNEFAIVIGDRFIVKAEGDADINSLRSAVSSLDLQTLESMKDVGVTR